MSELARVVVPGRRGESLNGRKREGMEMMSLLQSELMTGARSWL